MALVLHLILLNLTDHALKTGAYAGEEWGGVRGAATEAPLQTQARPGAKQKALKIENPGNL